MIPLAHMKISDILDAIWLGILQGITEFLPISSSAHLIVSSWLVGGRPLSLELNIALHFGTALAVLFYFKTDWLTLIRASYQRLVFGKKSFESNVMIPALIFASIPAAIFGLCCEKTIEQYFHHPVFITIPLFFVGITLWLIDRKSGQTKNLKNISIKSALIIGLAQATALIPGVSRSGATILAARYQQFTRVSATKFSFLLGTPIIVGATLLKSRAIAAQIFLQPQFYIGITVSFLVGISTIHFLLKFIQKFSFAWFAGYRCILAIVILVVYFVRL